MFPVHSGHVISAIYILLPFIHGAGVGFGMAGRYIDRIRNIDYNILTKTVEKIAQTYPPRRELKS